MHGCMGRETKRNNEKQKNKVKAFGLSASIPSGVNWE